MVARCQTTYIWLSECWVPWVKIKTRNYSGVSVYKSLILVVNMKNGAPNVQRSADQRVTQGITVILGSCDRAEDTLHSKIKKYSILYAPCSMLHAPCSMPHTLCSMLHAPCSMLYAPCSVLYAPCSMLHALCSIEYFLIVLLG